MRRASRTSAHAERGQNLIEFALLMPLVLVFIAAIVVFGLALNTRSSLQQAVREGARQASVGPLDEVRSLAAGNAPDALAPADVEICYPLNGASQGQVGDPVRVYLKKADNTEGFDVTLVATGGIFSSLGIPDMTVTMKPRATARLEKSVSPSELSVAPACPL